MWRSLTLENLKQIFSLSYAGLKYPKGKRILSSGSAQASLKGGQQKQQHLPVANGNEEALWHVARWGETSPEPQVSPWSSSQLSGTVCVVLQLWKSQEQFAKVSLKQGIAPGQAVGKCSLWQGQHLSDGQEGAKSKCTALGVHKMLTLTYRCVSWITSCVEHHSQCYWDTNSSM